MALSYVISKLKICCLLIWQFIYSFLTVMYMLIYHDIYGMIILPLNFPAPSSAKRLKVTKLKWNISNSGETKPDR